MVECAVAGLAVSIACSALSSGTGHYQAPAGNQLGTCRVPFSPACCILEHHFRQHDTFGVLSYVNVGIIKRNTSKASQMFPNALNKSYPKETQHYRPGYSKPTGSLNQENNPAQTVARPVTTINSRPLQMPPISRPLFKTQPSDGADIIVIPHSVAESTELSAPMV